MTQIKKYIKLFALISFITFNGCSDESAKEKEQTEKPNQENHQEDEHEINVVLTEEQIKFMGIETEELKHQNISGYIRVNGEVMINPDKESKVGSIISGRVRKIYVKEGSYVRAGQTLAVIENPELINVQVEYINAKNEYEYVKREYERHLKLNSENIGSKKTLNEHETAYKKALANYKTLEDKLTIYKISKSRFDNIYDDTVTNLQRYYTITAPISGNIVKRNLTVGQYVEPSSDLFNIVDISTVFVDLNVFEQDLQHVSTGQKVALEVSVSPDEVYEGSIIFVNKVFDDEKRTVRVRVAINNKREKLLPFMFVTAKIYVNEESVLAVPISALETEGESKFIFIKTGETKEMKDEHNHQENGEHKENNQKNEEKEENEPKEMGIVFEKVPVNTGISDDKYVQIFPLEELKQGIEIVSKGSFYLKSELKKGELGGHED